MLTDVNLLLDDDYVLEYKIDSEYKTLPYTFFQKYWPYAEPTLVENAGIRWSGSDNAIIGYLTGASDQTGIIFGWNAVTEKFFHISNGDFVVGIACTDTMMYSLALVYYYGHPATFCLNVASIDTMDPEVSDDIEMLNEIPADENVVANSLYLDADKSRLIVKTECRDIEIYRIK